jgi:hypothetical protein
MSDEMIMRVAKAIVEKINEIEGYGTSWEDAPPEQREAMSPLARAAIEAMCKPTEEMICEGDEHIIEALNDHGVVRREPTPAEGAWRAMIRTALGDSVTEVLPGAQKTL